jgi:predicted DNA-binding transcriptional regulator AlpA
MWNTSYQTHDGPSTNRLWEDEDIAAYVGFQSIDELIARHSDFPKPVPLGMQGRRWRPCDIFHWIDRLCSGDIDTTAPSTTASKTQPPTRKSNPPVEIPEFDTSLIAEQLREVSRG